MDSPIGFVAGLAKEWHVGGKTFLVGEIPFAEEKGYLRNAIFGGGGHVVDFMNSRPSAKYTNAVTEESEA